MTEGTPADRKPADEKPADVQAGGTQPAEPQAAEPQPAEPPAEPQAAEPQAAELQPAERAALAGRERLSEQVARTGMFGAETTGDTSGYGGLMVRRPPALSSPRPYGSYFDDLADLLGTSLARAGLEFGDAIERVVADRGELTFHVRPEHLTTVAGRLRDDPALAFELCTGVSGVHYPADSGRELHAVYHLVSLTRNRRLRLEVSVPDSDPHIPTMVRRLPHLRLARAGDLGLLRAHLRRPPGADQDRDA